MHEQTPVFPFSGGGITCGSSGVNGDRAQENLWVWVYLYLIYLHCFILDYVSFKRVLKAFGIKIVNCIFLLTPVVSWFCLGFVAHMWQCFGVAGGHKHLEIHPQIKKNPKLLETTYGPPIAQVLTLKLCSWGEIFWYRNLLFSLLNFNAVQSRFHHKLSLLVSWISQKNSILNFKLPFFFQLYQQGRLCQLGSEFCELEVFAKVLRALDKRWVS